MQLPALQRPSFTFPRLFLLIHFAHVSSQTAASTDGGELQIINHCRWVGSTTRTKRRQLPADEDDRRGEAEFKHESGRRSSQRERSWVRATSGGVGTWVWNRPVGLEAAGPSPSGRLSNRFVR